MFITLDNNRHKLTLSILGIYLWRNDLSLSTNATRPTISFFRVFFVADEYNFLDSGIGDHLFHELIGVMAFS